MKEHTSSFNHGDIAGTNEGRSHKTMEADKGMPLER